MRLQKSIKDARRSVGLSQLVLSYRAKVSRFRLSLAERGFLELRCDELDRIKNTLQSTLVSVLNRK